MTGTARPIHSEKIYVAFAAICFIALSVAVRTSQMDADIFKYTEIMPLTTIDAQLLREPIVWIGQKFLYQIIHNSTYNFVIFDIVAFSAVLIAWKGIDLPQYAILAIIVFFPFIMGMQNIYRQWFAACLFLLSLATIKKNPAIGISTFILAVVSHNVAAVFAGVLFLHSGFKHKKMLIGLSVIATPLAIWIGGATKSSAATGLPLHYAYVVLLAGITLGLFILQRINKPTNRNAFHAAALVLYIAALSALILSSAASERVSQFGLILLYPTLVLSIESNFQRPALFRAGLVILGFIPMFFFGVRDFIV